MHDLRIRLRRWLSPREWRDELKHRWQRATRGYSYQDLWSLDFFLAKHFVETLTAFRAASDGCCPGRLESREEWEAILDEMIEGFALWVRHWEGRMLSDEELEKFGRARELFAEWFAALWY